MSETSTILSLPYIQASQAQKHITHNEAIRRLDALVQPVVSDMDRTVPPAAPGNGDRHIVAPGAAGDWLGRDGTIAVREDAAWAFVQPADGWRVHVLALAADVVRVAGAWGVPAMRTTDRLGINAAADATNRLAVSAEATLLTHAGGGHQLKLNKATAGDTGSLLFQTAYSGRAEMGTSGGDGFAIKVSADGAAWREALAVDPASGRVRFPSGASVPGHVSVTGRWACNPDNAWVTFDGDMGATGATFDTDAGTLAEPQLDWSGLAIFAPGGAALSRISGLVRPLSSEITGFDLRVVVQYPGGPAWNSEAGTTRQTILSLDGASLAGGWTTLEESLGGFVMPAAGQVSICLRPQGAITATRHVATSLAVEIVGAP